MQIDTVVKVMVTFTPFTYPESTTTYFNHEVFVMNEDDPEVITLLAEEYVLDMYEAGTGEAKAWHAEEVMFIPPAVSDDVVDEKPKRIILKHKKQAKPVKSAEVPQIQLGDTGLAYRVTHKVRKLNGEWKTTEVTVLASKAAEAVHHATKVYGWAGGKTTVARIPA